MDKATQRRHFLLGCLLLVCVAAAGFELWRFQMEVAIRDTLQAEGWLRGRSALVQLERSAGRIAQMKDALGAMSNKLGAVEAQYKEELATHEPLRRQIEQMMQEAIAQKVAASKKTEALTAKSEQVTALEMKHEAAAAERAALTERLKKTEAALSELQAAESALRAQLDREHAKLKAAEAAAEELKKQLELGAARQEAVKGE